LDTNAIIGLLNHSSSRLAHRVRQEKPSDIAISAIGAHELFYGAFRSRYPDRNAAVIDGLEFPMVEFDKDDARESDEIRAALAGLGTPIGPYDVLIAGQAVARDLILVSHNLAEFGRVPRLKIEDWEA
jgi:tRNA(fMet)-specific endonuclease VapC